MYGHAFFGKVYFSPHYFGPADQTAAGVQVLNYGVMRRRREEYERREEDAAEEFAHEIAAAIEEGLPEPLRPVAEPERASPGADALEAAALALSRVPEALATDEAVTARIAAAIEARLRGERVAEAAPVEDDYDDDEAAILTLLLAPLVPIANDDDEEALLALLLAA